MPDTTIWDIETGIRNSWESVTALTDLISIDRLYLFRPPDGATMVYTTYEFEDISAFFGGTEYFSGPDYRKQTRVIFTTYGPRTFDWRTYSQALSNAFGCSATNDSGQWSIPNAIVLFAQPETENIEVLPREGQGEDVIAYKSSFTLTMQADRG